MSINAARRPDPAAGRPRRRRAALLGALLALGVPLAGCGAGAPAADGRLQVVTSFYPLQYVAQRVAGPQAEVSNLTHPGQEPHDLELSVQETASVVDADVVVYERGFQAAVDEAVDQIRPARVVDASVAAGLSGDDPHFWLDPTRLDAVAVGVERQLAAADPAHAAAFARNLRSLRADLAALDRSYRTGLATCRLDTIVVSHDAFGYLGRRYGLRVVGINGLSPDAEPSPSHIRALQRLISSDRITTVFAEELGSRKLADSLAGDLGLRTEVLDPIEGLGPDTADQDYLSLMRRNLRTLEEANQC